MFRICPSWGVGTGLFHRLKLKGRAGGVARIPDPLTLAVLTSCIGCVSYSCQPDAAVCLERRLFALPICDDALTPSGHSQTIPTPLTRPDKPLVTHPSSPRHSLLATFSLTKLHRRRRAGRGAGREGGQSVTDGLIKERRLSRSLFVVNAVLEG